MRILVVSQEFPPETHWGGIGTYMGMLAPALARAGAGVEVLSVAPEVEPSDVARDGMIVHRRPVIRPRGSGLARLPETWKRLTQAATVAAHLKRLSFEPDLIVCPSWQAEALFLRSTPLAVHVFSSAPEVLDPRSVNALDRRLAIALEDRTVRRARVVLSPPAQLARTKARLPLRAGSVEIACPVAEAEPLPHHDGPPTIAFVGRLEHRKAPETLVRAMPSVLLDVPDARLVLAGRDSSSVDHPSYVAWLRSLARELGVAHAVATVEGWGDHGRVRDVMMGATVVAVPSRWESFGYVAAEASAAGRAVVVSDITSFSAIVEDGVTGLVARRDDVTSWAEALVTILRDPAAARRMGAAGASRMRRRFSPDVVARDALAAYERALATPIGVR